MTEEDADKWEIKLRDEITKKSDKGVARAVVAFLTLYLENGAITRYIRKTKNQGLRNMMPEILSAEEMALMGQRDQMFLSPEQINKIALVVKDYQIRLRQQKYKETSSKTANSDPATDSREKWQHLWDNPEVMMRMIEGSKKMERQNAVRNRRLNELQAQLDKDEMPVGNWREVKFQILEMELYLNNLLEDTKQSVSLQDAQRIIEVQNRIAELRAKEQNEYKALVVDIDGNYYSTVRIGDQVWMAENLKTTKFNNGLSIPYVKDNSQWQKLETPGYCWYNNDKASHKNDYGALYNWYAVNSSKLCPPGWHVPNNTEWAILTRFKGGDVEAGDKLKESGTGNWLSPNDKATNVSGFNALPGGIRSDYQGNFDFFRNTSAFWSATNLDVNDIYSWAYVLFNMSCPILRDIFTNNNGFSIRCIKDN